MATIIGSRSSYSTDEALDLFRELLLETTHYSGPLTGSEHPLVQVQASKALIGLRPENPSMQLIHYALRVLKDSGTKVERGKSLIIEPDELGLSVSVQSVAESLYEVNLEKAQNNMGRLLLVSDNKNFMFDILLEVVSRNSGAAIVGVPVIHYAMRAFDFIGEEQLHNCLELALEAAIAGMGAWTNEETAGTNTKLWALIPALRHGSMNAAILAGHCGQIAVDEHLKGEQIIGALVGLIAVMLEGANGSPEMAIHSESSVEALLGAADAGDKVKASAICYQLTAQGERVWLLDVIESLGESRLTSEIIIWADTFRMLLRTAPPETYSAIGAAAGLHLSNILG